MTTARDIVTRAIKLVGYYGEGEEPSAAAVRDGLQALNDLMASWHNQGLLVFWPPGTVYLGDWKASYVYAVGDAVSRSGNVYSCTAAHTSTTNDQPGNSPGWSSYWELYSETPLALSSTFPLDASHDRGVVAILALEVAPLFNVDPQATVVARAREGMVALYGTYFRVPNASVDSGITRMPSQIWPYSISQVQ